MTTAEKIKSYIKSVIKDSGRTQTWLVAKINEADPGIGMSTQKLSASLSGKRKISADEFLAICKALAISSDLIAEKIIKKIRTRPH